MDPPEVRAVRQQPRGVGVSGRVVALICRPEACRDLFFRTLAVSTLIRRTAADRSQTNDSRSARNCPSRYHRPAREGRCDHLGPCTLLPAAYKAAANNLFHRGCNSAATSRLAHRTDTGHIPGVVVWVVVCSHTRACKHLRIGHALCPTGPRNLAGIRVGSRDHTLVAVPQHHSQSPPSSGNVWPSDRPKTRR